MKKKVMSVCMVVALISGIVSADTLNMSVDVSRDFNEIGNDMTRIKALCRGSGWSVHPGYNTRSHFNSIDVNLSVLSGYFGDDVCYISNGQMVYNWAPIKLRVDYMRSFGIEPMIILGLPMAVFNTPEDYYAFTAGGCDLLNPLPNLDKYKEAVYQCIKYFNVDLGYGIKYWVAPVVEPDRPTPDGQGPLYNQKYLNYFEIYKATSLAIDRYAQDFPNAPRVKLGGPESTPFSFSRYVWHPYPTLWNWYERFVRECCSNNLRLDFITMHIYNNITGYLGHINNATDVWLGANHDLACSWGSYPSLEEIMVTGFSGPEIGLPDLQPTGTILTYQSIRSLRDTYFPNAELIMTELLTSCYGYGAEGYGLINGNHVAASATAAYLYALFRVGFDKVNYTMTTQTTGADGSENWAGGGLLTKDSMTKAVYNTYRMYALMENQRIYAAGNDRDTGIIASKSNDKISILLWNHNYFGMDRLTAVDKTININLDNVIFDSEEVWMETDVVQNGGFENGDNSWINYSEPRWIVDNTISYEGVKSLKILSGYHGAGVAQLYAFAPYTTYSFTAMVKGENTYPNSLQFTTYGLNGGYRGEFADVPAGTFDWTKISYTFTTGAEPGTGWIGAVFFDAPYGTFWIDNIQFGPAKPRNAHVRCEKYMISETNGNAYYRVQHGLPLDGSEELQKIEDATLERNGTDLNVFSINMPKESVVLLVLSKAQNGTYWSDDDVSLEEENTIIIGEEAITYDLLLEAESFDGGWHAYPGSLWGTGFEASGGYVLSSGGCNPVNATKTVTLPLGTYEVWVRNQIAWWAGGLEYDIIINGTTYRAATQTAPGDPWIWEHVGSFYGSEFNITLANPAFAAGRTDCFVFARKDPEIVTHGGFENLARPVRYFIENNSFENNSQGWNNNYDPQGWIIDNTVSYSGDKSLKILSGYLYAGVSQIYTFEPNTTYTFTVMVKGENVVENWMVVAFDGKHWYGVRIPQGTYDWTKVTTIFTTSPEAGSGCVICGIGALSNGTYWFDDVVLNKQNTYDLLLEAESFDIGGWYVAPGSWWGPKFEASAGYVLLSSGLENATKTVTLPLGTYEVWVRNQIAWWAGGLEYDIVINGTTYRAATGVAPGDPWIWEYVGDFYGTQFNITLANPAFCAGRVDCFVFAKKDLENYWLENHKHKRDDRALGGGWIVNSDNSVIIDKSIFYEGTSSLRILPGYSYAGANQGYTFEPNATYTYTAMVKGENVTQNNIVIAYDGKGWYTAIIPTGTYDWTKVTTNFTTSPTAGMGNICTVVNPVSAGTYWFDNISIKKAQLQNASFETYRGLGIGQASKITEPPGEFSLPPPENMIIVESPPDNWNNNYSPKGWTIDHFSFYTGVSSLKILSGNWYAGLNQGYKFEPNKSYTVTAMVKGKNVLENNVVIAHDGKGWYVVQIPTGTYAWTKATITFTTSSEAGSGWVGACVGGLSSGTYWFDDVSIEEVN